VARVSLEIGAGNRRLKAARRPRPPPPPEVSGWVIHKTPPDVLEEMRQTFNEVEFLAELREAERAGLPELKDLIRELEQDLP
jgi:hypothetical protein